LFLHFIAFVISEYTINSFRCYGGFISRSFQFEKQGVPTGGIYGSTTGCQPYSIPPNNLLQPTTPVCSHDCIPQYGRSLNSCLYYGSGPYWLTSSEAAMQDMYNHGPIVGVFEIFEDLFYYKSGVYQHKEGGTRGYHAVRIMGWGEESGEKYWLIANSWNTTFGIEGNHG
uniref:Pept_C1 domain-containing protein n=1 Tax=Soboliphyme baturini TaxID=241478 RepID=A0A183IYV6_9BILA